MYNLTPKQKKIYLGIVHLADGSAKLPIILVACFFILLYLIPLVYIFLVPARRIPQEEQPSIVNISEGVSSGILWRASDLSADQFSNEDFPESITCGLSGSDCTYPKPRVRTFLSNNSDWLTTLFTIPYFPLRMIAGGGVVLFPLIAIFSIIGFFPKIKSRFRRGVFIIIGLLVIFSITVTYFLAIGPHLLSDYFSGKRPIVWEGAPLAFYLRGGISVYNETRIIVVNGTAMSIDLYADGLWVDRIPARTYRKYFQLRNFSGLTSIDTQSHRPLDDINFQEEESRPGILVYNVQSIDHIWIDYPPEYR